MMWYTVPCPLGFIVWRLFSLSCEEPVGMKHGKINLTGKRTEISFKQYQKGNFKKVKHCRALVLGEVCIRLGLGKQAFSPKVKNALGATRLKFIPFPLSLGT